MKVAVRIWPLKNSEVKSGIKFEGKSNQQSTLSVSDGNLTFDPIKAKNGFYYHGKKQFHRDITIVNKNLRFKFDDLFEEEAQNRDVFERLMKPLVHSLMDGLDCSFINYGATETGKTHTVLGNSIERGVAYLTMEYIFFQLNKRVSNEWIYEVSVSYLEVYNEKVVNLLSKSKPLTIAQKGNGDARIIGLDERKVSNLSEVQKLLTLGNRNRTRHSSENARSTQSNTIFQIHINTPNQSLNENKSDNTVTLVVVELGGSERNTAGSNSADMSNTNKPILTFKNCLHRLAVGSKDIPFNESPLTKILKNSLTGKSFTVMLFNVSSSATSYNDTYNTLMYANRAKQIGESNEKQNVLPAKETLLNVNAESGLKRNTSYTISTTIPVKNKSIFTVRTSSNEVPQRSKSNPEVTTELTRWYYEISTIYDAVKAAVDGYCTSVSKEALLELRLKCRNDVENCRVLLVSTGSNRMTTVRVKSLLDEITKQAKVVPNKVSYWKSRLQICQQQLQKLHRKVKEIKGSTLEQVLESYILMKEFEVSAMKAYHESTHIMKTNAIYVSKTEIYGYLSVLGVDFQGTSMVHNACNEWPEMTEIADICLPLYADCLAGSKTNSQTKCDKVNSRTSINVQSDI